MKDKDYPLTLQKNFSILTVITMCEYQCRTRELMPLQVAFAKTIYTFQGMNAGLVDPGWPPNMVVRIIVDPGNIMFESQIAPVCLYIASSCDTTMGDMDNIYKLNSGIYF